MAEWRYTVRLGDVWRNEDLTFEQRRDEIVRRLRGSGWYRSNQYGLAELLDELEDVDTAPWFDAVWCGIYDLADEERAWIDLRSAPVGAVS